MLHAPTSEVKTETTQSKSQLVPQPERELHPRLLSTAGLYSSSGASGVGSGTSPEAQRRQTFAGMQGTHGNQAVLRMLHSPQQVARMCTLRPSQVVMLQRKCACGSSSETKGECEECKAKLEGTLQRSAANPSVSPAAGAIQTKLAINKPGDQYEQEADRIADQVMTMPAHHAVSGTPPRIQRFSGQSNGQMDAVPASVDQALASPGRPLELALRQDMEQRFGHDFSRVRVHSGAAAEQSARDVNAHAYTVGHNMVFGAGRFAPGTQAGRRLLSHELTHVVQQGGGGAPPGPAQKRDADAVSRAVEMGARPQVRTRSRVGLAAQTKPGIAAGALLEAADPENAGLKIVTVSEIVAKIARILKAPGFKVAEGRKDFNASPGVAKANLYHTHFRNDDERLSYALGVFQQSLGIDGNGVDPDELFATLVQYEMQVQRQEAEQEALRQWQEKEVEKAKKAEAIRLLRQDYYERGARLAPVDADLIPIEQTIELEKEGRASKPYKDYYYGVWYHYGQTGGRCKVVLAGMGSGVVKVNDLYYYRVDAKTLYDVIYGNNPLFDNVWEKSKGINVAYGHVLKGLGELAGFSNPLGQLMGPTLETAGKGMLYDVRAAEASERGDVFTEKSPEIGWDTLVQGVANVVGGKFGAKATGLTSKFAPKAAPFVGTFVGMETTGAIEKTYQAAQGNVAWSDVLKPDFSVVDVFRATFEGKVLHTVGKQWTTGRDPKVPVPTKATSTPTSLSTTTVVPEPPARSLAEQTHEHPSQLEEGKSASTSSSEGHGQEVTSRPTAQTSEDVVKEHVVHEAASQAGSEVKLGDGTHGVAAYGKGEKAGFEFCSSACSLVAEKLEQLEKVLPENSEVLHNIRFLKNKVLGLDKEVVKGKLTREQADHAAHDIAEELKKYAGQDPMLDKLLQMSPGYLKANRAQLRKELRHATERGQFISGMLAGSEDVTGVLEDPKARAKITATPSPGPEPRPFLRGNFAHRFAEFILGPNRLPRPNEAEVVVMLRDGTGDIIRADRIIRNADEGLLLEIKPAGRSARRGEAQLPGREAALQREFPKRNGWQGEVVEYTPADVRAWLRTERADAIARGLPVPDIPKIMKVLGF